MTSSPGEMRLDELARRAGVASTTVRLYQGKGLLPPPRLVGRTGWYDRRHLARLGLVARLQEQGFSLAGIARLFEVGAEEQLDTLLRPAEGVHLSPAELAARYPAEALTPELLDRAAALGLVEPTDDGRFRVPDRRFLDLGAALAGLGVPVAVVLDEWERLVARTDEIADRFVDVFRRHLAPPGVDVEHLADLDPATAARLADTLAELRRHARQVVATAFDTSLQRAVAASLAPLLDDEG